MRRRFELILRYLFMNFYYQIEMFVVEMADKYDEKGKKILDVGAGTGKHKENFKKISYTACDVSQNKERTIDIVGDFIDEPKKFKKEDYDYVLCIQVLEHFTDPKTAFSHFNRVLKPGGRLFLTTNFIYQTHMEPVDYFRFTKYGLNLLGEKNGFKVERVKPQGGIFSVLVYVLVTLPLRLGLEKNKWLYYLYLVIFSPVIILGNLLAVFLDKFDREKKLTINYEAVYVKND